MLVHRDCLGFLLAVCGIVTTIALEAAAELTNVAPLGVASQSTTAFGGAAGRANDGETNGAFFNGSVTHTAEGGVDPEPFWEVSFANDFAFESITFWNRTDCCGDRLSDLTLSVYDDDVEVYNSFASLGDFINPFNELGSPESINLDLAGTVGATFGDRVRVARLGQPLSLAEVQIFADTNFEPFPVLEIGRQTGLASLRNNTNLSIDLAGYSIRSSEGNLDPTNWLSIAENYDSDSGASVDADDPWLEFTDSASTRDISEGTLGTATLVSNAPSINLGAIWTPNPSEGDITALLLLADGLTTQPVDVNFVDQSFEGGDFDQDGDVDGGDFLQWQRGNSPGPVSAADLAIWNSQFGNGPAAALAVTAVPEPSTWALLVTLSLGLIISNFPPRRARISLSIRAATLLLVSIGATVWLANPASAAVTVDRLYEFGDLPIEDASANITVGSGPSNPASGNTLDSDGTSGTGDLQDLQVAGNPMYVDVTGRPMGGTGLGIKFDGNDSLLGDGIGFPQGAMSNPNADYSGIFTRGFMGWVKPDAAGLGNGNRQDVVADTQQFQFYIDENDNFAMRHGVINLTVREREVASELTAQADTWYHFQLHAYGTQPGVLYIDGLAVAAVGSFYGGAGLENMGVGANEFGDDFFFTGTVDDLTMYVAGVNDSEFDFGAFDLLQDNPFMAQALTGFVDGDLNGDGLVQGDGSGGDGAADDVRTFIDNWSFEKLIPGSNLDNESIMLSIGDMETRLKGDFNLDGVTDLLDWGILRSLHPDGASLNLSALLEARSVPEPSTGVMLGLLVTTWLLKHRSRAELGKV